jgi:D-alanine-D-alanine ligase
MNMSKLKVAVIYGGRSTEHKISILSAKNIVASMPKDKYEPILIGIDKSGRWILQSDSALELLDTSDPNAVGLTDRNTTLHLSQNTDHRLFSNHSEEHLSKGDVIFPVLHGMYGEDGAIQGFAKLANIPCVGPGILGSAIGMDKEVMKRLLRDAGIKNAPFVTLRKYNRSEFTYDSVSEKLGEELFVKPVNLGSSVGVSYVQNKKEYETAVEHAFLYDNKVIIESKIQGREIECAVLGNDDPMASIPGEVIPKSGFYSYESKYLDEKGAKLAVPAQLSEQQIKAIQETAIDTYRCLECSGMARVDMFMLDNDELYINEINTIPGFTDISMYPTLWRISGLSNEALIDRLIQLAIEEQQAQNSLKLEQ